eukprot:785850-Amorphochlora_amoeboformis.AAC.1
MYTPNRYPTDLPTTATLSSLVGEAEWIPGDSWRPENLRDEKSVNIGSKPPLPGLSPKSP